MSIAAKLALWALIMALLLGVGKLIAMWQVKRDDENHDECS